MIIPATRTQIVNAATNLIRVFTAGGQEITVEQHPDESVVSIDYDENKSYSLVENGRLYLVVGDVKIDITDQCSETDYYRYEITTAREMSLLSAVRSIIPVGSNSSLTLQEIM